ncbi:DUF2304 domain-containing protein [Cellulomonas sp.]|uniref:DUF2304 domain-containing protein n=1 Tax=Cellulomonas sp. TaxID=40001 RepID=UPI001B044A60|nr:DUF2304 domain-containing protein [Cellulomonas sp.]MBO9556660.1 DUF2304 domain-containing protein [Cellulomonas sp.]
MLIKVLLLLAIAVVVVLSLRAPAGARHLAVRRVSVTGFAALAVLSVLFPDAWNAVAQVVGVGRGTDLLLYGLIVVFLGYLVTSYRRFRDLEGQITRLARRLALDEVADDLRPARVPGSDGDPPSEGTPGPRTRPGAA